MVVPVKKGAALRLAQWRSLLRIVIVLCSLALSAYCRAGHVGYAAPSSGVWFRAGQQTVFLDAFSPGSLVVNLAMLAGTYSLSHGLRGQAAASPARPWWLNEADSLVAAGFVLGALGDLVYSLSASSQPVNVDVLWPWVDARLVFTRSRCDSSACMTVVANPLAPPLASHPDSDQTSLLLKLHSQMLARSLHQLRLVLLPAQSDKVPETQLQSSGDTVFILAPGAGSWLEAGPADGHSVWSLFDPAVLQALLDSIETGQTLCQPPADAVRPLVVDRAGQGWWSAALPPAGTVLVEGKSNADGRVEQLHLLDLVGMAADSPDRMTAEPPIWQLARPWSRAAVGLINSLWLAWRWRAWWLPDFSAHFPLSRLTLARAGLLTGAGACAGVQRQPRGAAESFRAARLDRLEESTRVQVSGQTHDSLQHHLDPPWHLELTGRDGRRAFAALDAATCADSRTLAMDDALLKRLGLESGDPVFMQPVRLDNLRQLELEVLEGPSIEQEPLVEKLQDAIDQRYPVLHQDDIIRCEESGAELALQVRRIEPPGAAYTVGTEPAVDIARPSWWTLPSGKGHRPSPPGDTRPFSTPGHVLGRGSGRKTGR